MRTRLATLAALASSLLLALIFMEHANAGHGGGGAGHGGMGGGVAHQDHN